MVSFEADTGSWTGGGVGLFNAPVERIPARGVGARNRLNVIRYVGAGLQIGSTRVRLTEAAAQSRERTPEVSRHNARKQDRNRRAAYVTEADQMQARSLRRTWAEEGYNTAAGRSLPPAVTAPVVLRPPGSLRGCGEPLSTQPLRGDNRHRHDERGEIRSSTDDPHARTPSVFSS